MNSLGAGEIQTSAGEIHVGMPDHGAHCFDYDMEKMGSGHTCAEYAAMEEGCTQEMRGKHFKELAKSSGKTITIGDFCPVSCGLCDKP
jgi:hypothetical protein